MSKVAKGVKKAFDGVKKGVKKVFEGVKKVFKKVWESQIGRILLIAAAVYLGGAALGAWQSPFTSINGALAAGESAATVSTTAATAGATTAETLGAAAVPTVETVAPSLAAGESVAGFGSVGGAAESAGLVSGATTPYTGTAGGFGSAGGAAQSVAEGAAAAGSAAGGSGGYVTTDINSVLDGSGLVMDKIQGLGNWAKDNPLLAAMGLNAGAQMLTPSPAEAAKDLDKREEKRRRRNMRLDGLDVGVAPGNPVLKDNYGKPVYPKTGIVGGKMGG